MLADTCWVPSAACWTLREISCVAAPCSSTAAAMVEDISDNFSMVPLISLIAPTDSWVADWMPVICWPISPVAFAVCSASLHLRRHDGEAAPGFASTRRLDGGIQGQQIGLSGDGVDQFDDVTNAGSRL